MRPPLAVVGGVSFTLEHTDTALLTGRGRLRKTAEITTPDARFVNVGIVPTLDAGYQATALDAFIFDLLLRSPT